VFAPPSSPRVRRVAATLVTTSAVLSGCVDATAPAETGTARVRIVNSVFQGATAATAQPVALDVLIDGATTAPGAAALAPNSVAGTPAGAASAPGYADVRAGVRAFDARVAGETGATASLFTTLAADSTPVAWVPRQYLTAGTPYTLVVAGLLTPARPVPAAAVPFVALVDDPFAPPRARGTYQARFRLVNAAPFTVNTGRGAAVNLYVTPGDAVAPTAPALGALATQGVAGFRAATAYTNVDAGDYWVSATSGGRLVYQARLALGAGEVRTLVLQSTGYAVTPGTANHVVTNLLDATH